MEEIFFLIKLIVTKQKLIEFCGKQFELCHTAFADKFVGDQGFQENEITVD